MNIRKCKWASLEVKYIWQFESLAFHETKDEVKQGRHSETDGVDEYDSVPG